MQNGLNDKNRENRIRHLARRHGCVLRKSRARKYVTPLNDQGEFMVVEDAIVCSWATGSLPA